MDMKTVIDRIEATAKAKGMSLSAVSLRAGMSKDGVRNWKRRLASSPDFGVTYSNLQNVADVLEVPAEWLAGEPATQVTSRNDHPTIPVFDVSASAGQGITVNEYEPIAANLAFPENYLRHITSTHPRNLAIISVTGGSMMPTVAHDDIVMVDTTKKNTSFDGIFVVRVDDLLKVKRVQVDQKSAIVTLRSDNPLYPDETRPALDVEVIGRVVWMGTKSA